jgi:hypothetical protein
MTKFIAAVGLATAAAFALALPAQANDKKYGVAACSKNNTTNCKTGAVQNYNMGQKVRLPGGTWVSCVRRPWTSGPSRWTATKRHPRLPRNEISPGRASSRPGFFVFGRQLDCGVFRRRSCLALRKRRPLRRPGKIEHNAPGVSEPSGIDVRYPD